MALPTYFQIATTTVGSGGVASVTFSGIPATYTDLVIRISARSAYSGVSAGLGMQINGLTTSIYTMTMIQGNGTSAASNGYTNASNISTDNGLSAATATANTFDNVEIYIPNYLSSNIKSVSVDAVTENNATTAYAVLNAGVIATSAAITSLTFLSGGSANLVQNSTFTLYGISNA